MANTRKRSRAKAVANCPPHYRETEVAVEDTPMDNMPVELPQTSLDEMPVEAPAPTMKAAALSDVPVKLIGPFTADGSGVLDASGSRVAICGFDHNRAASGGPIAEAVAIALNRFYGTKAPEPRVDP